MRLKPIISYGLLAGVLALPAPAFAVALGRLIVSSSLGQPLVAEVEVASANKDELESLAAKIADPAAYRQSGLEYQGVLTRIKVAVEKHGDGRVVLKLSSSQSINEPYVDLLLDVNWASGRLLREYTFLLDPPGYVPAKAAAPTPVPVAAPVAAPRGLTVDTPATATTAPTTVAAPLESTPAPEAAEAAQYGPTKKGDTLGKIARQVKPEGVTLEQMLVALFQANQGAFDGKNMNRLRTGQSLSVPSGDQAAAVASNEAAKLVRIQAVDWRGYRDRVAGAPASSLGEGSGASSGRISTAVTDTGSAAPAGDQLKVSRADGAAGGKTGKGKGAAAAAAIAEDSAATERALKEANTRVVDLEKTVKDLQRLVDLKNKQLADLQSKASATPSKPDAVVAQAPTQLSVAPKQPEPVKAQEAPKPVEAPKAAEPPKPEPLKVEPAKAEAPPAEAPKPSEPAKTAEPPQPVEPTKVAEAPKPVPKAPAPKPVEEPAWYEDLFADPMMVLGGGAAIAALGGLWAVLAARRRRPSATYEDSILTGTDIKTNTVFGNTGGGVVNTGDNSLTTGFSRQGLGNIDTDEVDPIAEAEVYLAYGRDAQAEEILRDALQKDPNRQEVYLKLLEIQAQHNKVTAFETLAQEFYGVSKGHGEAWEKAAALGRQLDPKNALYAAAEGSALDEPAAPSRAVPDEADTLVPAQPAPAAAMPELKFAPDRTQTFTVPPALAPEAPRAPAAAAVSAPSEFETLDFSLDDLAPRTVAPTQPPTTTSRPSLDDTVKLDDLDWDEPSIKTRPAPSAAREPALPEIRIPEPALEVAAAAPAPARAAPAPAPAPKAPAAAAQSTAGLDLDKLDLSFDPDRIPFEDPTPSVLDGQWHDAATKLDLAKAYQEMGDIEGAREILREVLHEGDEAQKKDAQAMLDRLH